MSSLLLAATLGLGSGLSPGPLLTLVIKATLERGFMAGARVASAPLVTDLPIIVVSVFFLTRIPDSALSGISVVGGVFVVYLGVDAVAAALKAAPAADAGPDVPAARDLWQGALVNILSPHPWLAWLSVLGPLTLDLWHQSRVLAGAFVALFYAGLIGSKVAIAAAVARGRRHLRGRWYRAALLACGLTLVVLGLLLFTHGIATYRGATT